MLNVDEMLQSMSSHALTEWMAYYRLEPFGDELLDLHMARLTAVMTSTEKKQSDPKKFRLWQVDENKDFDPQAFFDGLKEAAQRSQDKK